MYKLLSNLSLYRFYQLALLPLMRQCVEKLLNLTPLNRYASAPGRSTIAKCASIDPCQYRGLHSEQDKLCSSVLTSHLLIGTRVKDPDKSNATFVLSVNCFREHSVEVYNVVMDGGFLPFWRPLPGVPFLYITCTIRVQKLSRQLWRHLPPHILVELNLYIQCTSVECEITLKRSCYLLPPLPPRMFAVCYAVSPWRATGRTGTNGRLLERKFLDDIFLRVDVCLQRLNLNILNFQLGCQFLNFAD